jgi:peptidoglycan/LPS O-acetylase OafA/YrhL
MSIERPAWAGLFLGRPRTRHQHFDALDGLRGLAVLIVIASHMALLGFGGVPGVALGGIGKSGVYLFFVLSAFLLTRILVERTPAQFADPRVWAAYAMRRILRIWPLYLVVLVASWLATTFGMGAWPYPLDAGSLVRHLALREGQSVLWSIPVEFKFYGVLPVVAFGIAWMLHRGWRPAAQLAALGGALGLATLAWPPSATGVNDVRLGPYLAPFLCGAFAAGLDRSLERSRSRAGWGVAGGVALAAIAATTPPAWAALSGAALDSRLNHQWFVFFGLAWATLLLAVLRGPGWLRRPFASVPLRLAGAVSFSAYLWHLPVMAAMRWLGVDRWPGGGLWTLLAITAVSMASYLAIERPWRDVRLRGG